MQDVLDVRGIRPVRSVSCERDCGAALIDEKDYDGAFEEGNEKFARLANI